MKKIILILVVIPFVGCASRLGNDVISGGALGGITYAATKNPLYSLGAAAGGVALSEFVQAGARKNDVKIYNRGYDRARSDTTKQMYWIIQNTQKNKESKSDEPKKFETVQVVLPPRPDGVKRTSDVVTVKMDKTQ